MVIRGSDLPESFITLGTFNASFGLAQIEGALKRGESYDAAKLLLELTKLGQAISRCGAVVVRQIEKDAEATVDERLSTREKKVAKRKRK